MRWHRLVGVAVGLFLVPGRASTQTPTATAFIDVAVIPMNRERVLPHQTVIVYGDRIAALGSVAKVPVPAGARRIDGRGRYLLPGLGNMHVHPFSGARFEGSLLVRYLVQGVTTIRDMHSGGPGSEALQVKRAVAAGTRLGPRIYTAGDPAVMGSGLRQEFAALADSNEDGARQRAADALSQRYALADSIAALQRAGHDFVKLYAFPPPAYDSVVAAAHRVSLRIAGHVPSETGKAGVDVPLSQVLRDRWASIEHLTGYFAAMTGVSDVDAFYGREAAYDTMTWTQPDYRWDRERLRELAIATREAGVWNCPTLALLTSIAGWAPADAAPKVVRWRRRLVEFYTLLTTALQDAGAGLILGSDNGKTAAEELHALVTEAGLTPYQALTTGTRNVAAFLGALDSTGTVAVGKRADLVLLDGNPLQDIQATASPAGVMVGGRWLSRAALAAMVSADAVP